MVNPWSLAVVTVTIVPGVDPSPDMILEILIGSDANAPTISNSGLCFANPNGFAGNLSSWRISLSGTLLNEFDNLL